MYSQQFQETYESIYNSGTRLLEDLQEIRESRHQEGDNTEGFEQLNKNLYKSPKL